jgi:hypothetical protein
VVLAGLALIAVAIFGALLLLAEDDDGGSTTPVEAGTSEQQQQSELGSSLDDPKSGIAVQWPADWVKLERKGVFAFRSPDRTLVVAISTPAEAADADELRKGAIASNAEAYEKPVVRHGKGRTIGGLEAEGATISGKGPSGESRSLVAVAAGKERAYLFEVLTAASAPTERLVEAQLILNSLRLTR